jgi:thiamine-phosphate pyrophosphorylase
MNRVFSLIDANINRAREGLRVVEDLCRFVFRDRVWFEKTKEIRHRLLLVERALGSASALSGRSREDIGREMVVESEFQRSSLYDLLRANFSRVAEALRVLEEISKIFARDSAHLAKDLRYEIYNLEHTILLQTPHFWIRKYFEQGVVYPISSEVNELIWLIDHGAKVVQLRDKESTYDQYFNKAKYLCEYIKTNKNVVDPVLLLINDYVDIAAKLPVAGVHIGQKDGNINQVRRQIGLNKIIGRSNNSLEQLRVSIEQGFDYVSIGPVFATPTKPEANPVGLEVIRQATKMSYVPLCVIGGIDENNANDIYDCGIKNISVIRAARKFFQ